MHLDFFFFLLLPAKLCSPHTQDMPIAQILHCVAYARIWSITGGFDVSYSVNVVGQYFYIRSYICHIKLGHMYVCSIFFSLSL